MIYRKNKFFPLFLVVVFVVVILAGCSKKEEEKITLVWQPYSEPVYLPIRREWAKDFEMLNPDIKIKYEPIPGNYIQKILTQIAGGTAPDIFVVTHTVTFIQKGALLDLTDYVKKDTSYLKEMYPSLIEGNTYNGRMEEVNIHLTARNVSLILLKQKKR